MVFCFTFFIFYGFFVTISESLDMLKVIAPHCCHYSCSPEDLQGRREGHDNKLMDAPAIF